MLSHKEALSGGQWDKADIKVKGTGLPGLLQQMHKSLLH